MQLYMGKVVTLDEFLKLSQESDLRIPDVTGKKEIQGTYISKSYGKVIEKAVPNPIPLEKNSDIRLGYALDIKITKPTISVIYEIQSDGLEITENENYVKGDDSNNSEDRYVWKAKEGNYKIIKILIGPDTLHEEEKIYLGSGQNIYIQRVDRTISERTSKAQLFNIYIKSISYEARRYISPEILKAFRYIFGNNGIMYNVDKDKNTIIQNLMLKLIHDPDYKKFYALEYLYNFVGIEDEKEIVKKVISDYSSINSVYEYKKEFMYYLITILTEHIEEESKKKLEEESNKKEEERKEKVKEEKERANSIGSQGEKYVQQEFEETKEIEKNIREKCEERSKRAE